MPFLRLDVHPEQKDQVAPNSVSLAEAHFHDNAWYRGIYWNEEPVGFVMLSIEQDKNEVCLWRYMIDKKHQGKGYGAAGLDLVIEEVRNLDGIEKIDSSYWPQEDGNDAGGFYRKYGFKETGELLGKEVCIVYSL